MVTLNEIDFLKLQLAWLLLQAPRGPANPRARLTPKPSPNPSPHPQSPPQPQPSTRTPTLVVALTLSPRLAWRPRQASNGPNAQLPSKWSTELATTAASIPSVPLAKSAVDSGAISVAYGR